VISYRVTQEYEVEELIKKWIPYVKVLEPLSLIDKIENELKEYLQS
jgi:predicted DNA-binding transcriptional regulator YafY